MTDVASESTHSEIAKRLLDGRTAAASPAVSPDGSRVAFVVSTINLAENKTTARIWLAGPEGDPVPVTAGPFDVGPVWSPDGRRIAFSSRRGEKDLETTVHVLPIDGPGESRTVVTMDESVGDLAWSPDGKWLAFTSRTRDARYDAKDESWQPPRKVETFFSRLDGVGWVSDRPNHVYVVPADGTGEARNLTPGPHQHSGVSWLRDSSGVVTAAARHDGWDRDLCQDLYVVPLEGDIRALTKRTGSYAHPSVSPDGTTVAFLGLDDPLVEPQNNKVGVISLEGGKHRWISQGLDRTFAPYPFARQPVWLDDQTLLALGEDRGETHLFELSVEGAEPKPHTSGPIVVQGFDAASGRTVTAQVTVERPAEIFDGNNALTSLTRSFLGWERFAVPTADGTDEIDAWIMRPEDFSARRRYPVLLNVHGGPFTQYGEMFFDEAQMQAAAGFVVLMCNPRGSSGRDTAWGQAINGPKHAKAPGSGWGTVDVDDIIAVLDEALDRYSFCDPDRVGMLGGSYGGYMATTLAGRHGDRFRAICSERAVNNMISEEWSADIGSAFRSVHGVDFVEDPEEYVVRSPMQHVRDIDVPMLLIHSEDDLRCPISQAEELFMTLRLLDKDVTFYRFPAEGHDLSRGGSPLHRRMRAEIILDFFAERTKPRRKRR